MELEFTKEENKIMALICKELSDREIGIKLKLKTKLVNKRTAALIIKTNSKTRVGVALYYFKSKLKKENPKPIINL